MARAHAAPGVGEGMGTQAGLLHAIISEPADDTARLVYADWLDEHDQPDRAAVIRVQVELTRLEATGDVRRSGSVRRRFDTLRAQADALLGPPGSAGAQKRRAWAMPPELEQVWPHGVGGWDWHRGFPERWWCPLHLWLKCGRAVVAHTPVRQIIVTDRAPATEGGLSPYWYWYRGDESRWAVPPPDQSILPADVFDLLPDDPLDFELFGVSRRFPSEDVAQAALSEACAAWAWPRGAVIVR